MGLNPQTQGYGARGFLLLEVGIVWWSSALERIEILLFRVLWNLELEKGIDCVEGFHGGRDYGEDEKS